MGNEGIAPPLLTLGLHGVAWSASGTGCFITGVPEPAIHYEEDKKFLPLTGIDPRLLVVHPVAWSLYRIDRTTSGALENENI
jgi:hypothetical protein